MLSRDLAKEINNQINAELWSAYFYLSMSMDAHKKGFKGIANWFKIQFQEEQAHAEIFINYLHAQNEKVVLSPIAEVKTEWDSVMAYFEDTLEHEKKVTAMIHNLVTMANNDNDYPTQNFLSWFVDEQVEEEENVRDLIYQSKMLEGNNYGLYMFDKELATRVFNTPSPLVK